MRGGQPNFSPFFLPNCGFSLALKEFEIYHVLVCFAELSGRRSGFPFYEQVSVL